MYNQDISIEYKYSVPQNIGALTTNKQYRRIEMTLFIMYVLGAVLAIKYEIAVWYFLSTIGVIILSIIIKRDTVDFDETKYDPVCNTCNEGNDACPTCKHKPFKK
jgi:hypothetical protein